MPLAVWPPQHPVPLQRACHPPHRPGLQSAHVWVKSILPILRTSFVLVRFNLTGFLDCRLLFSMYSILCPRDTKESPLGVVHMHMHCRSAIFQQCDRSHL